MQNVLKIKSVIVYPLKTSNSFICTHHFSEPDWNRFISRPKTNVNISSPGDTSNYSIHSSTNFHWQTTWIDYMGMWSMSKDPSTNPENMIQTALHTFHFWSIINFSQAFSPIMFWCKTSFSKTFTLKCYQKATISVDIHALKCSIVAPNKFMFILCSVIEIDIPVGLINRNTTYYRSNKE